MTGGIILICHYVPPIINGTATVNGFCLNEEKGLLDSRGALTQEIRHGAHTGSLTERRSSVPVSEGSSARQLVKASKRLGIQNKYAVGYQRVQGKAET